MTLLSALFLTLLLTACTSNSGQSNPPDLLDNTAPKQEWYCYGKQNGGTWRCGNEEDRSQIAVISPSEKDTPRGMNTRSKPIQAITKPVLDQKIELFNTRDELPSSVSEAKKSLKSYAIDGQHIREQPKEYYTVQVLALGEKEKLNKFARDRNLDSALIAHTVSQGSEWYVLLLGIYPNFALAKKAHKDWIKANPKHTGAWIRELGPLQATLVEAISKEER